MQRDRRRPSRSCSTRCRRSWRLSRSASSLRAFAASFRVLPCAEGCRRDADCPANESCTNQKPPSPPGATCEATGVMQAAIGAAARHQMPNAGPAVETPVLSHRCGTLGTPVNASGRRRWAAPQHLRVRTEATAHGPGHGGPVAGNPRCSGMRRAIAGARKRQWKRREPHRSRVTTSIPNTRASSCAQVSRDADGGSGLGASDGAPSLLPRDRAQTTCTP